MMQDIRESSTEAKPWASVEMVVKEWQLLMRLFF